MRVLMATDGSEDSVGALWIASRILRKEGLIISLLCVAPDYAAAISARKIKRRAEQYRQQITSETERILERGRSFLRSEGIEAESRSDLGSPADKILASGSDYDLIVVGSHGRRIQDKPGLGPVASQVVAGAGCPVIVARETPAEESFRVLVAMDGSIASQQALRFLVRNFNVTEDEITLMHVVEMPWLGLGLEQEWLDGDNAKLEPQSQLKKELRSEAEAVLDDAQRILEESDISGATVVAEGSPGLEILSEAETGEYDLIVLGAVGLADLKHTMIGSVSTKVASNAPCSVLIFKYPD